MRARAYKIDFCEKKVERLLFVTTVEFFNITSNANNQIKVLLKIKSKASCYLTFNFLIFMFTKEFIILQSLIVKKK